MAVEIGIETGVRIGRDRKGRNPVKDAEGARPATTSWDESELHRNRNDPNSFTDRIFAFSSQVALLPFLAISLAPYLLIEHDAVHAQQHSAASFFLSSSPPPGIVITNVRRTRCYSPRYPVVHSLPLHVFAPIVPPESTDESTYPRMSGHRRPPLVLDYRGRDVRRNEDLLHLKHRNPSPSREASLASTTRDRCNDSHSTAHLPVLTSH